MMEEAAGWPSPASWWTFMVQCSGLKTSLVHPVQATLGGIMFRTRVPSGADCSEKMGLLPDAGAETGADDEALGGAAPRWVASGVCCC